MVSAGVGAIIGAVIAAGASGVQMNQQRQASKRADKRSNDQQRRAANAAASASREEMIANNEANRDTVDPTAILAAENNATSTMGRGNQSGAGGINPEQLRLGTAALLGE